MAETKPSNELRYYDALKRITCYMSPDQLRRQAEKKYGLSFEEALKYAYENVLNDARLAIKGRRRPDARCMSETTNESEDLGAQPWPCPTGDPHLVFTRADGTVIPHVGVSGYGCPANDRPYEKPAAIRRATEAE